MIKSFTIDGQISSSTNNTEHSRRSYDASLNKDLMKDGQILRHTHLFREDKELAAACYISVRQSALQEILTLLK